MIDIIGTIRHIYRRANNTFSLVNADLTLQETGGTITIIGAGEYDVYRVDIPMGVFEPCWVVVDLTHMAAGDTIILREYYRMVTGLGLLLHDRVTYVGVQDIPLVRISLGSNRRGVLVTIEQTLGVLNHFDWFVTYKE